MSVCASPYWQSRVKEVLIKHCSVVESAHTHLYAHGTNKLIMQKSKTKKKARGFSLPPQGTVSHQLVHVSGRYYSFL